MDFYKDFLIYHGTYYTVYFHAEEKSVSSVHDYFEQCDNVTQASLLFLVKRLAEIGRIYDDTKFRIEDKTHKIYAFKAQQERFFCFFFIEKTIIVTSAYRKKKQKLDIRALKTAIEIRRKYIMR